MDRDPIRCRDHLTFERRRGPGLSAARLAALGARIVKVEPPTGDPLQAVCPTWYGELTVGQEVVTIDLKDATGRARFAKQLPDADVLITAMRPSALHRLGLDQLSANYPRLSLVEIVGHDGHLAEQPGHDLTYQAGYGTLTPPVMPTVPIADLLGAERAVSAALAALLARGVTGTGQTTRVVLDGADGFDDFRTPAATAPETEPDVIVDEGDEPVIIYTSGTTGNPKGALFDHHRILWVGHNMSSLGLTVFDRQLHVAPLDHCAELVLFALSGFSLGTTYVLPPAFEPGAVVEALEKYRINVFLGVPTMYQMMLAVPGLSERDLAHWRLGFFGAAPMPPTSVQQLVRTLPNVGFMQLCGPTEGRPSGIYSAPDEVVARPDATGRWPIGCTEIRLATTDGGDATIGEPGEILLRGETVMKRYWNKPEATAEAVIDGWLHTGDLAIRDADGFFTIVDRLKDMIITSGHNVYSVEVENALAANPQIQDVAGVSRVDEVYGETIVAIVTPTPGATPTIESVREHAADCISYYKLPRELVIGEIPRNPSGKILKHVLRAQVRS